VTVFIDAAVVMYASGAEHPYRDACRAILEAVGAGRLDATTSVEVVQEIGHRYVSIRQPERARDLTVATLDLFAPVLPITHAVMRRVPDLMARYPRLDSRDLVHVATCIHEGISEIISADRAYDAVAEVKRIDPLAFVS
jgi:predicted nucleic acid-binding protein